MDKEIGTTNQLLAALSLIVIAVYLKKLGRSIVPVVIPMVFLVVMTIWAMVATIGRWLFGETPNYLLAGMGVVILLAAIWMSFEAWSAFRTGAEEPAPVTS